MAVEGIDSCLVNGINLTAKQCEQVFNPPSLFDKIFGEPWLWIMIASIVIVFLFLRYRGKSKDDPATKPWYGRIVRKELMAKEMKKRFSGFGQKPNVKTHLQKGIQRIGLVVAVEHDKILTDKLVTKPNGEKVLVPNTWVYIDRFQYRRYGFIAWLKSLFGYGFYYISITPETYKDRGTKIYDRQGNLKKMGKARVLYIDPKAHFFNDSDIWSLATDAVIKGNEEVLMKAHHENIHGYEMDFLRRLAVQSPTIAGQLEKASHEQNLKEKDRKSRTSGYS
jgi:hypothetical protein